MRSRLAISSLTLWAVCAMSCSARQAIRQDEGKALLPPILNGSGPADLTGFNIAPLCSMPLTATIEAENSTTDAQGNTTTVRFRSKVVRDSFGRTRLDIDRNPEGAAVDLRLVNTSIFDAVSLTEITITPFDKQAFRIKYQKVSASKRPPAGSKHTVYVEPSELSGLRQSQPQIDIQREELGHETLQGMAVRHGRETMRYPAGFAGNPEAVTVVTDYWFSQELQAFVQVKRAGPGNSLHTLMLQNITHQEAEKSVFAIPRGYKVVEAGRQEWHSFGYCPVP
jgi:hypothetical protein